MSKPLRVQIKGPRNDRVVLTLDPATTYEQFFATLKEKFSYIRNIEALNGFPPKKIDVQDASTPITGFLQNGDTVIVQENESSSLIIQGDKWELPPSVSSTRGCFIRKRIPGDNSCFFHCVNYCVNHIEPSSTAVHNLRETIANIIASNPSEWDYATLGMTNQAYQQHILHPDSWGGAVDCAVLSKTLQVEICVMDYLSLSAQVFGQDTGYKRRIYLLFKDYKGAGHYDALVHVSADRALSKATEQARTATEGNDAAASDEQALFRPDDRTAEERARAAVEALHAEAVAQGMCSQKTWKGAAGSKKQDFGSGVAGSGSVAAPAPAPAPAHPSSSSSSSSSSTSSSLASSSPTLGAGSSAPLASTISPTPTPSTTTTSSSSSAAAAPASPVIPVGPDEYSCPACSYINKRSRRACEMCDTPAPASATAPAAPRTDSSSSSSTSGGGGGNASLPARPFSGPAFSMDTLTEIGNYALDDEIPAHLRAEDPNAHSTAYSSSSGAGGSRSPSMPAGGTYDDEYVRPPDETRFERLVGDEPPRSGFGGFGGLFSGSGGSSRQATPASSGSSRSSTTRTVARDWNCSRCTLFNARPATRCAACDAPAPEDALVGGSSRSASAASTPSASAPTPAAGAAYGPPAGIRGNLWCCEMCGNEQPAQTEYCRSCGYRNTHISKGCTTM